MKKTLIILIIFFNFFNFLAQEIEKADDSKNKTVSLINVFINTTYKGNTITDFSDYNVDTKKLGEHTLILKILKKKRFKERKLHNAISFDKTILNNIDTVANNIIKKVINNRKYIFNKTNTFFVNKYSKNSIKIKDAPKKILGIALGDIDGSLDKTRSGIIYQSETYSEINKTKKQLIEQILAVKVNIPKNKIGFNRAANTYFNFYQKTLIIGDKIISPIANNAFKYYKFELEKSFRSSKYTIHKIKIIPKRKLDNVFNGYLYIVENYWQLYKVDLFVDGKQIQQPNIELITIKQQFKKADNENLWLLKTQNSNFDFKQFEINVSGSYFSEYKNYNFAKQPLKTSQVFSVNKGAYNKDVLFWEKIRPSKLTLSEIIEYDRKEAIHQKRSSKSYLDSITNQNNGFIFTDLVFNYNYRNLYKKSRVTISFPFNTMFNTVQGWHSKAMFTYFKDKEDTNYSLSSVLNYGFADKQTRITGHFNYKFSERQNAIIKLNFGRQLTEFNYPYSIAPIFNSITSLLLEENNAKFYDKHFVEIKYGQEIINGLEIDSKFSYEDRKPVFNNTKFTLFNWTNADYNSNNPLNPTDFNNAIIDEHDIFKINLSTTIRFGQKYMLLSNDKINLPTQYPKVNLNYTKGVSLKDKKYNFNYIEARVYQDFKIRNKGFFSYNIKGGRFINKDELSFIDYKHFNVIQVHVNIRKDYTNQFALLPLYGFSTNNHFTELHAEHHFEGFLLQKIPLINKLQFKLIIGANTLFTKENKPYSELNIGLNNVGFGKFRFFRIDYVRTFHNNNSTGGVMVGLSL